MEASKKDIENAIMFFAKKFNLEKNYEAIISSHIGLPKLVELIVFEMFLNGNNPRTILTELEIYNYSLLYTYATELRKCGFVTFNSACKDEIVTI